MIPFLPFHYSRILPIAYDNYLSETERLQMMIEKVNNTVEAVNKIGKQLEEAFDAIEAVDKQVVANTRSIETLKKQMSEAFLKLSDYGNELMDLRADIADEIHNRETAIDGVHMELGELTEKVDEILPQVEEWIDKSSSILELSVAELRTDLVGEISASEKRTLSEAVRLLGEARREILRQAREAVTANLLVRNPVHSGITMPLQQALDFLAVWEYGLTAREYRILHFTSKEYTDLVLTAFEYKFYKKFALEKEPEEEPLTWFDLTGHKRENTLSSVYTLFPGSQMSGLGILNAHELKELADNVGLRNLQLYGRYYGAFHGAAMVKDLLVLRGSARVDVYENSSVSMTGEGQIEMKMPFDLWTPYEWENNEIAFVSPLADKFLVNVEGYSDEPGSDDIITVKVDHDSSYIEVNTLIVPVRVDVFKVDSATQYVDLKAKAFLSSYQ